MKRLLLVGVLLILFSIPVLAGEYLMNDTGQTVYGLTVAFSEPVTITGFGDVLMTVEPTGESTSFTFSGGEVEAWGGHWLNWEPDSATLVSKEWLMDVVLSASQMKRDTTVSCNSNFLQVNYEYLQQGDGQLQNWAGVYHMGPMADSPFPSDGVVWGNTYTGNASQWENRIAAMLPYLSEGKPFLMKESASTFQEPHPELEESVAMVDAHGDPIVWEDKESWQINNIYRHNIFHPLMQELIRSHLKAYVDAGATGVTFDDYGAENIIRSGGTFDVWTEEMFRDYLAAKYTDSQLRDQFSITNIDSFSMGEWIRERGLSRSWNRPPFRPIVWQYILFLFGLEHDVFVDLADYANDYAYETQGRGFSIGANAHPESGCMGRLLESCDYLIREDFAIHNPERAIADLFRAMDAEKPRIFLVEFGDDPRDGVFQMPTMSGLILREIGLLSTGGASVLLPREIFRHHTGGQYGESVPIDHAEVARMVNHLTNHRELYSAEPIPSRLGVLFDEASNLNAASRQGYGWWGWSMNVLGGTAEILYEQHIPFDFVYVPDPRFSDGRISLASLSNYDVILVPDAISLPEYVQELLLSFIRDGGSVIATGDTAKYNLDMNVRDTELRSILDRGQANMGHGHVTYILEDPGRSFRGGRTFVVGDFMSALERVLERTVRLQGGGDVLVALARQGSSTLVHISNRSYEKQTDQLISTGSFEIGLKHIPSSDMSALLVSPDFCGFRQVSVRQDGDWLWFSIPAFESTATLILTPQSEQTEVAEAKLSTSETSVGSFVASISLHGPAIHTVEWRVGDTTLLSQCAMTDVTFAFRTTSDTTFPFDLRCIDAVSQEELYRWEMTDSSAMQTASIIYDFEPAAPIVTRKGEVKLYGWAKELSEEGLAGVEYFEDRGAVVEASISEDTTWKGNGSLMISYSPLLDDDWGRLFTGIRLTNLPSSGLDGARYLEFAYQISNPAMYVYFVFVDCENEAFEYGGKIFQRDSLWHKTRIPLSSFRFGGYGSHTDGNRALDLEGLKVLMVNLVLQDAKGTTEYVFLDNIALTNGE